jgi:hypothetical protein
LTDTILGEVQSRGLDTSVCRSLGYDSGANVAGVNSGVNTKTSANNPRAFFTVCGCHKWNLLLGDAAKSSRTAVSFYGLNQRIYTLFHIFEEVGDFEPETRNNLEASFYDFTYITLVKLLNIS